VCNIFGLYYENEEECWGKLVEKLNENSVVIDSVIENNEDKLMNDIMDGFEKSREKMKINAELLEKITNELIPDNRVEEKPRSDVSRMIEGGSIFKYSSELDDMFLQRDDRAAEELNVMYDTFITETPTSLIPMEEGMIDKESITNASRLSKDLNNVYDKFITLDSGGNLLDSPQNEERNKLLDEQLKQRNMELMSQINSYYGEGFGENLREMMISMK
jgi:hypothetical protein